VGMIGESDLVRPLLDGQMRPDNVIDPLVNTAFTSVSANDPVDRLPEIFQCGHAAVVVENGTLRGIVTQIDLICYLIQKEPRCFASRRRRLKSLSPSQG